MSELKVTSPHHDFEISCRSSDEDLEKLLALSLESWNTAEDIASNDEEMISRIRAFSQVGILGRSDILKENIRSLRFVRRHGRVATRTK